MREWFKVKLQADPAVAEIHIIDYIGGWIDQTLNEMFGETVTVTAKAFVQALAEIPEAVKTLRVHVNSPGGDLFGAVNIANALRAWATKGRKVETIVDGMAASAASLVVMAGDPVRISDNGLLMIHNPWTVAMGNAAEMRQAADELDKFRSGNIIPTYQWHTELSAEEIAALMDATTWMDAKEAVAMGFADEVVQGLRAAASIDPRTLAKLTIPEKYADRVKALLAPKAEPTAAEAKGEPMKVAAAMCCTCCEGGQCCSCCRGGGGTGCACEDTGADCACCKSGECCACCKGDQCCPDCMSSAMAAASARAAIIPAADAEIVKACGEAGLDLAFAQVLIGEHVASDALPERIASEKQARATAKARETEIRALCAKAKQPDLADGYVAGGMKIEQVRQQLTLITAKLDKVEIDGGLEPDHGSRRNQIIDIAAVYAERNRLGDPAKRKE